MVRCLHHVPEGCITLSIYSAELLAGAMSAVSAGIAFGILLDEVGLAPDFVERTTAPQQTKKLWILIKLSLQPVQTLSPKL